MEALIVRCPRSEDNKTRKNIGFFGSLSKSLPIANPTLPPDIYQVTTYVLPFEKSPPTFSPLANFPDYPTS